MTKTVLLASSALVSFALASQAVAAPYEWSGFYIGANVGGTWGDVDLTGVSESNGFTNIAAGEQYNFSPDGVFGGLQLGYNFQFAGGWLLGLEVEGRGMDFDEVTLVPSASTDVLHVEQEWGATAAARLGFVLSTGSLLYVKGGYAAGNIKTLYVDTITPGTGTASSDETHSGWVVGAGFEHMIGENVSFGVEYNYIDLGSQEHFAPTSTGGNIVYDVDVVQHAVSARLNWHWNPY